MRVEKILFEAVRLLKKTRVLSEQVADWVCTEIARYNKTAGKIVNPAVIDALKMFRPSGHTVLYRGLGIPKAKAVAFLKKNKLKAELGAKGVYDTGKRQSWTTDMKEAVRFAGLHTIVGRDPNSLGVVLKTTVAPDQIAMPLGNLPKEMKDKCLHFDQQEYVLEPGKFPVEIVQIFGEWSDVSAVDINAVIKDVSKSIGQAVNGKVRKTWNKQTGFAIDLLDYYHPADKWYPSIQVLIEEDFRVAIEAYGPYVFPENARKHTIDIKTANDLVSFLKNDAQRIIIDMCHKIKPWLELGKESNWDHAVMKKAHSKNK